MNNRLFLLTFDLEEFDLPTEYGEKINKDEMYDIGYQGIGKILEILKKLDIAATFFTTGNFAKKYPKKILDVYKNGHEIASHGLSHADNYEIEKNLKSDLSQGKKILEEIINEKIIGFRAPRLQYPPFKILKELKFRYDSSIHPTYIPGRYNNTRTSRNYYKINDILEIPASVTPLFRLPFSWIWFRNIGLSYAKICTNLCFFNLSFVTLYFHSWEFVDSKNHNIPFLIENRTGEWMNKSIEKYLNWCLSKQIKFITMKDYISNIKNSK